MLITFNGSPPFAYDLEPVIGEGASDEDKTVYIRFRVQKQLHPLFELLENRSRYAEGCVCLDFEEYGRVVKLAFRIEMRVSCEELDDLLRRTKPIAEQLLGGDFQYKDGSLFLTLRTWLAQPEFKEVKDAKDLWFTYRPIPG